MKNFRIFNTITDETILFIKAEDIFKVSNWIFKNYGDIDTVDVEEAEEV